MKKPLKFPMVGYMAVHPDRRIVKVKVDNNGRSQWYSYRIVSLDPDFQFGMTENSSVCVSDVSAIGFYPSREKAIKGELEKLHKEYRDSKRALRLAEKKVKWTNRRVFEYKNYEKLMSVSFE
jgi:hypothetical protein